MIRINKYLSLCGVTSRRGAEKMIAEGRVTLNNITIEKVGLVFDETVDEIRVDGVLVQPANKKIYLVLNKPRQVMTTLHDPFKRKTVLDCLTCLKERVYPVGRLDFDTQGVLLLTNDGELAFRLTHPKFEILRVYEARVKGTFTDDAGSRIEKGIRLEDGATGHGQVELLTTAREWSRIRMHLREGRKREVRQLCKAVGHPVQRLTRTEFAGINSGGLKAGDWRHLTPAEVKKLQSIVGL
ncbi:MAG: pseudouridine synthase [bacterium]|nr:pseudouridine synthase [bacterium]